MAVPKIAVIALVAIVAAPILLGYAFNFEDVAETQYSPTGDPTIVTPLLYNDTSYATMSGDSYTMNGGRHADVSPLYVHQSSVYSPGFQYQYSYASGVAPDDLGLTLISYFHLVLMGGRMTVLVTLSDSTVSTIYDVVEMSYNTNDGLTVITTGTTYQITNAVFVDNNAPVGTNYGSYINVEFTSTTASDAARDAIFIDYIAGFRPITRASVPYYYGFPSYADSLLLTLDLYSTSNDFSIKPVFDTFDEKTIDFVKNGSQWDIYTPRYVNGSWVGTLVASLPIYGQYNSIYQLQINKDSFSFNYVGTWPGYFGQANSYRTYGPYDLYFISGLDADYIRAFTYTYSGSDSAGPTMRIDDVQLLTNTYNILNDVAYDPVSIKPVNPVTTISKISLYGSSIQFGGNTYTVTDGSITLGGHKVRLEGIKLDSIPNSNGGYDNRINGIIVSSSVTPSTITFDGKWQATIETDAIQVKTIMVQKWVAGDFAWNGIDDNFKIVGLLSSLGVFVALGIYSRYHGMKVLPFMIVCACAALIFFVIL